MHALNLDQFPQPEDNDPGAVQSALEALRGATDEASAAEACDAFLWAMGNNHAGTYYPVVLAVLPEIEKLLVNGRYWAQQATIEALVDLGGPFAPEQGYETYLGGSVRETLKAFIHSLRRHIVPLTIGDDPRAKSAADLVELIEDQSF